MIVPPLSLYVHLPWCVRKCPYCDFNSHTANDATPRDRYIDALLADIDAESDRAKDRELMSVFLGGGTPSFFSPAHIARIVERIADRFSLSPDIEITMEANPGTVECGDPAGYRAAGVNRLSIGAQSFCEDSLRVLGRIHSTSDIRRAVDSARDAGFDNINIDVMFGLPDQGIDAALADISAALDLQPQHFSWYQLTLEPNTVFYARPPNGLPDDDLAADIQRNGQALLAERGFRQYEVSAYATGGHECRHNLNYWSFGDYLAAGAGAHGKLTEPDGIRRYTKPANPEGYMRAIESGGPLPAAPVLTRDELLFEFMLNALRLADGFSENLFTERTGLGAECLNRAASDSVDRGLIKRDDGGYWRPTPLGRQFLNDLQAGFLS
ncbi:MAG: radical SAM family heme chaperone HemW [Gammaproteobacteria bacterium]|nr:radical SAM family heme chaperone HemW [Gammaproteobacteria bacterium]